jgi:hypothetical protein
MTILSPAAAATGGATPEHTNCTSRHRASHE